MANNKNAKANLKPFKKGDTRINRKGRPKTFQDLRDEAIKVAGEVLTAGDGKGGVYEASRVHVILLDWASSRDVRKQQLFMEYTFGKVPTKEEHSGKVKVEAWQDELIALLRSGEINADDVRAELGDEIAGPIIVAASTKGLGRGETDGSSEG